MLFEGQYQSIVTENGIKCAKVVNIEGLWKAKNGSDIPKTLSLIIAHSTRNRNI